MAKRREIAVEGTEKSIFPESRLHPVLKREDHIDLKTLASG